MPFPSISIITPSLNQGDFIGRTIGSVLNQGIPGLEYMVIDGGSTDQTVAILRRYEDRIRWVSERDGGQADAVNKGIRATKGEIIGWLNSDDMYYPEALDRVGCFFRNHSDTEVVYGRGDHIDAEGRVIEPYPTEPWDPERLKQACFLCQPAVFFRRRATTRFGLLNERLRYCVDYEYWLRMAVSGAAFFHIPHTLAATRLHPAAKTLRSRLEAVSETMTMMHDRLGHVPNDWLLSYARTRLNRKGERRLQGRRLYDLPPEPGSSALSERHFGKVCLSFPFALSVVVVALLASLRWNGSIRGDMLRTLACWIQDQGRQVIMGYHH